MTIHIDILKYLLSKGKMNQCLKKMRPTVGGLYSSKKIISKTEDSNDSVPSQVPLIIHMDHAGLNAGELYKEFYRLFISKRRVV